MTSNIRKNQICKNGEYYYKIHIHEKAPTGKVVHSHFMSLDHATAKKEMKTLQKRVQLFGTDKNPLFI